MKRRGTTFFDWGFWVVWFLFLTAVGIAALVGCEKQPPPPAPAPAPTTYLPQAVVPKDTPPGSRVTIQETWEGGGTSDHEKTSGRGAGLSAAGDKLATDFNGSAPTASTTGGGSTGGGFVGSIKAISAGGLPMTLGLAGLALLGLGGFCLWRGWKQAALLCGLLGAIALVSALQPALMAWLLVGGIAVAVVLFVNRDRQGVATFEALRAVVSGVEEAPPEVAETVKGEIAKQADRRDRDTIRAVKRKEMA